MRAIHPDILAHLQARSPMNAALLVWFEARNRSTGLPETAGFWSGPDHREFSVGGAARTYHAAGSMISVPPLIGETGLNVRTTRLSFSPLSPEVQVAIRGYDTRRAPVEMHVVYFDAETDAQIGTPQRVFKGRVSGITLPRAAVGGEAAAEVAVSSAAEALIRTVALKRSDAALRARVAWDGFRRYTDVSGVVETVWGEERAKSP